MSTLAEIESAVESLPTHQQEELLSFLANRLGKTAVPGKVRKGLRAADRAPLEGLPPDLSEGTRERVRSMVTARHAANR